jgi:hypothetical protein
MIRLGTHYDIDGIVSVISACEKARFGEAKVDWRDEVIFHLTFEGSFTLVAEHDAKLVGYFVGRMTYEPILRAMICIEHHWFTHPDSKGHGLELMKAAEVAAKEREAVKILFHAPDERVENILAKAGYGKEYTIYGRAL